MVWSAMASSESSSSDLNSHHRSARWVTGTLGWVKWHLRVGNSQPGYVTVTPGWVTGIPERVTGTLGYVTGKLGC